MLLGAALVGAASANDRPGTAPETKVIVQPARIQRRTFDPAHPPAEMPQLKPPEAALCGYEFRCEVACESESTRKFFKVMPATITGVTITVALDVTIWLPDNATAKLSDHEEAHREISERVYRKAEPVARRLGGRLLGHALQHSVKEAAAAKQEISELIGGLSSAYTREIGGTCGRMQQYFDSITRHGTNQLAEPEAIARALAQEPLMAEPPAAAK